MKEPCLSDFHPGGRGKGEAVRGNYICDQLSAPNLPEYKPDDMRGVYPKDFVFDGWHPQCFCFVIPILVDVSEMEKENEAFLRGEEYHMRDKQITDYPKEFKDFVRDNADDIKASMKRGTAPYFVQNNAGVIDGILRKEKEETVGDDEAPSKKELTREDVESRFDELKTRIREGGIKSADVIRYRTQIFNGLHSSNVPLSEIDSLLNELTVAVDNADAPRLQKEIDRLEPFKPGNVVVGLKAEYTELEQVAATLNEINDKLSKGQKWSEHGKISLVLFEGTGASGSTKMDGIIKLTQEKLDDVKSAFNKMAQDKEITKSEADSIATLWHEINHNRNLWGHIKEDKTTMQTNKMELANEFVSRHTLGEFYSAIGIKEIPHQELMWRRSEVGYDDMVRCYETIISALNLNHGSVVRSVQEGLYRKPYDSQGEVLVSAIWETWTHKKNVPTIKRNDVVSLVSSAANGNIAEIEIKLKTLGYSVK